MTWIQLRQPNVNKPCTPGWCLVYVQDVFGIPAKQPSALADWQANTFNHADQNFPEGVAVPVWFSGKSGQLQQYGHVAVRMADGSVWSASHPTLRTPMHFASIDALNAYYSNQLIYLGWTEDVEDVRVIELTKGEEDMSVNMIQNTDEAELLYKAIIHNDVPPDSWLKSAVGQPWTVVAGKLYQGDLWKQQNEAVVLYPGMVNAKAALIEEVGNLDKQLAGMPDVEDAQKRLQSIKDALGIK